MISAIVAGIMFAASFEHFSNENYYAAVYGCVLGILIIINHIKKMEAE